ncbi:MAG: hypothetical protein JXB08_02490 [Bacilli bacterium]|nr:hypothetical protein [Bacilli bacterium]MBN2876947.1 hypothetical protein [Bacilli bacterium]
MKKLLILVGLVLVLFMTGCNSTIMCNMDPSLDICQITYEPITNDTTGEVQNDGVLTIIDDAEDFDFTIASLNTFSYTGNVDIPYVDIEEFLYVMHEGLLFYEVKIRDTFQLTYNVNYSGTLFGNYEYLLEIDADNQSIYLSDANFLSEFNTGADIAHDSGLDVVSADYSGDEDLSLTIHLEEYDIPIVEEDGVFFFPLYLANLFFTGDYLNVYQNADTLYITDYFNSLDTMVVDPQDEAPGVVDNLIQNTANFMALFMDNFYGLKEYKDVVSYKDMLTDAGLFEANSLSRLDEIIVEFIYGLDDLHTSVVELGYDSYFADFTPPADGSKWMNFYDVYLSDTCYERTEEFVFTEYDTYYILELNEFTLDTLGYLETNLVDLDVDKPIYIDLACNPGGSLVSVLELLTFMTNDPVDFNYLITKTNEIYTQGLQASEQRAVENDFYLFTTNMTYSAANLFTSMVKDNGLATVIGQSTSGGACAVNYMVLPNNMIISYSSYMAMLDENQDMIEDGISPDHYFGSSYDVDDMIDYVSHYYMMNSNYTFDDQTQLGAEVIDITFVPYHMVEDAEFIRLDFELSLYGTDTVIDTKSSDVELYQYQYTSTESQDLTLTVYVTYEYWGMTITSELYSIVYSVTI